jgi:hypothetical protein
VCPGQFDLRMYRRNISRPGSQRHVQCTGDKEQIGERWHLSCLILPSSVRRSRILPGWDVVAKADRGSGGISNCLHVRVLAFSPAPQKKISASECTKERSIQRKHHVVSLQSALENPNFLFSLASSLCFGFESMRGSRGGPKRF